MTFDFSTASYWLIIDKPSGYSSAKIVAIVKKLTGAKKVGHGGTLDPIATGILPIAVNKATKTCQYIISENKKYYFEITWGESRDTDDREGKVINQNNKRPSSLEIINVLPKFLGKINQIPPRFSAIKINGTKAYQLARNNQNFTLNSRQVEIFNIKLLDNNNERSCFEITCSKGTYIRSFARELASSLAAYGYISVLKRLRVGDFTINHTISLDKLKNIIHHDCLVCGIIDLRSVLKSFVEIELDIVNVMKIRNGQTIKLTESFSRINYPFLVKIINHGKLIGLGEINQDNLKPVYNL